jgi:hypothetical protein
MSGAMSEQTPPANKKNAKRVRAATPPAPRAPDEGFLAWRTWAVLGAALVGGVIAWKLVGSSYKHDVETICNAEKGSGLAVDHDATKVTQWVKDHLGTPEGNQFYASIMDTRLTERAKKLQDAAGQAGVSPCPLVASYEQLNAQGDARADVQHLCSEIAFPRFLATDDPGRLDMLEKWIDASAKSPRTKEVGAALQKAPAGPERAKVLADAASKLDIYLCVNAKTLESPPPPVPSGAPIVRLYADPQINGGAKVEDLKTALAGITPDLDACYADGITRRPDLTGKLLVKMEIDATGKVARASPAEDSALADAPTASCIVNKLRTMKVQVSGPLVSFLLPLELVHADK